MRYMLLFFVLISGKLFPSGNNQRDPACFILPDAKIILEILEKGRHDRNEDGCFKNEERNERIAKLLAGQIIENQEELALKLHFTELARPEKSDLSNELIRPIPMTCSIKAISLMATAKKL